MEKPKDKRKEINVDISHSQRDLLLKVGFVAPEFINVLTHLKVVFYDTRLMCVFYQEEIAPSNQLYKTKFLQFKYWCNKINGGEANEQQKSYLKPISKENMIKIAEAFGFELPEPNEKLLELKRKSEQVVLLESTVSELTKKVQIFEELLKSLTDKADLSLINSSKQVSENENDPPKKSIGKKKLKNDQEVVNKNLLGGALAEANKRKKKQEKAAIKEEAIRRQEVKNNQKNDEKVSEEEDENLLSD